MFNALSQTVFIGRNLLYLPQCTSTNSLLLEECRANSVPHGKVLITSYQTEGRGQQGNRWYSGKSLNLTFSIALHLQLAVEKQFFLSVVTSLAIVDYLKIGAVKAEIKWPNDTLIDGKKCGGTLIENIVEGMCIKTSVVGIGINVNQPQLSPAVSIGQVTGRVHDLQEELERLLLCFEKRLLQIENERALKEEYEEYLFGMNKERNFQMNDRTIAAEVRGVEESGKLLLSSGNEIFSVGMKELKWVF